MIDLQIKLTLSPELSLCSDISSGGISEKPSLDATFTDGFLLWFELGGFRDAFIVFGFKILLKINLLSVFEGVSIIMPYKFKDLF